MNFKIIFFLLVISIVESHGQEKASTCGTVLDLCIMFDTSASIKQEYFTDTLNKIVNMTERLNTINSIEFSHLSFSVSISLIRQTLKSDSLKKDVVDKIKALSYSNTGKSDTQIGLAVRYATSNVFNTVKDPYAPRVALIFTDGLFAKGGTYPIETEIVKLKDKGVIVYVIPISNQINYENIQELASNPLEETIIIASEYEKFYTYINRKTVQACNANAFKFVINYEQ